MHRSDAETTVFLFDLNRDGMFDPTRLTFMIYDEKWEMTSDAHIYKGFDDIRQWLVDQGVEFSIRGAVYYSPSTHRAITCAEVRVPTTLAPLFKLFFC